MHFSGFCFENEEALFSGFSNKGIYDISGFSYGAQKAMQEAFYRVNHSQRVQKLILYSPAFFEDKTLSYRHLQISLFKKNKQSYIQNFLDKTGADEEIKQYFKEGDLKELEELLGYKWDIEKMQYLTEKGVCIEVYLGECDKIINSNAAKDFFAQFALVYFIKGANHCLK